jgi:hypothetical protein
MGPITLFDKSFLQSLTVDESVWFDQFFYANICPLFYVETLADLSKTSLREGRSAEDEVKIIADKTPELHGGPCTHHQELCIANLMGHHIPLNGLIPVAGARPVTAPDGRSGFVYDASPESKAFTRWQKREFAQVEREVASSWRRMLSTLDLPGTAARMRALGIDSKLCKSLDEAHALASALVKSRDKPFEQIALLFGFVLIPHDLHQKILARWAIDRYRPLAEYAPYAAHVLTVELFFQIALGAGLISDQRASNRADIAYLFYLPFCMVFVSSDKLHRSCAKFFLRIDQEFVWGQDLKADLSRLDAHFTNLSDEEKAKGVMSFAPGPHGEPHHLVVRLWDTHLPRWRRQRSDESDKLSEEGQRALVKRLNEFTEAPTVSARIDDPKFSDPAQLAIQRFVRKRKGNWWLLPKDLKTADEESGQ